MAGFDYKKRRIHLKVTNLKTLMKKQRNESYSSSTDDPRRHKFLHHIPVCSDLLHTFHVPGALARSSEA